MKLVINGKETDSRDGLTVAELLVEHKVKIPEMISVEVNGRIIRRTTFDSTVLEEADRIEFLYFMGGGKWD